MVVVHRFDRFSRSQRDFLNLLHVLEEHGVAFVSVFQQLDTGTPMGRCMFSVMTAFGELERSMIATRTKDKIHAARRKGLWTGGRPVLGYDVVDKALAVNEEEASRVRAIYALYLELGTLPRTVRELRHRGWTNKAWTNKHGQESGGSLFTKTTLHTLLTNPLYLGKMRAGEQVCEGVHEAIVDDETWNAVQERLRANRNAEGKRGWGTRRYGTALLAGIARCYCGAALSYTYSNKSDRLYGYYHCARAAKEGARACPGSRVSQGELEAAVIDQLQAVVRDPAVLDAAIAADDRDREERRPEIDGRLRDLVRTRSGLEMERRRLVDAFARGTRSRVLEERLAELDQEAAEADQAVREARAELDALDHGAIDPEELRAALEELDAVWAELFPTERKRVLQLLITRVVYDGPAGEIAVTFRPGGPKAVQENAA